MVFRSRSTEKDWKGKGHGQGDFSLSWKVRRDDPERFIEESANNDETHSGVTTVLLRMPYPWPSE